MLESWSQAEGKAWLRINGHMGKILPHSASHDEDNKMQDRNAILS